MMTETKDFMKLLDGFLVKVSEDPLFYIWESFKRTFHFQFCWGLLFYS